MLTARMRRNLARLASELPAPVPRATREDAARRAASVDGIETPEGYLLVRPGVAEGVTDVAGLRSRMAGIAVAHTGRPDGLAVVDIETTGLAGVPLFLVGVLSLGSDGVRIDQHFARRPEEEAPLLEGLLRQLSGFDGLVTFNGTRFDLPFIEARVAEHRLPRVLPRGHLDLLPRARLRWGRTLPNCRLSTLEERVLGRPRLDDVPGSAVPALYSRFHRTGDWNSIAPVLRHNALDLVATAELLPLLATGG